MPKKKKTPRFKLSEVIKIIKDLKNTVTAQGARTIDSIFFFGQIIWENSKHGRIIIFETDNDYRTAKGASDEAQAIINEALKEV